MKIEIGGRFSGTDISFSQNMLFAFGGCVRQGMRVYIKNYIGFPKPPKTEKNRANIKNWTIQPIIHTPTARSVLV